MKIGLTTGDLDGIGLEIALKALKKSKIPKSAEIDLFCGKQFGKLATKALKNIPQVIVRSNSDVPSEWVEECTHSCLDKKMDALVTGPLSKPEIQRAGLKDLGHTEILARISGVHDLYMSFWGEKFNVVLVTGHRPLSQAHLDYTSEQILKVTNLTRAALLKLDPKRAKRPLALLGLNPHAGDQGLIGHEEQNNSKLLNEKSLHGPLPGDSAFIPENFKKYGAFLAAYHDQGLIAFKMAHGFSSGVHVTLGLPFLRTSVDHGPAKNLFGKNKADYGSMKAALEMALKSKMK